MKKLLIGLLGFITLGLINFGSCVNFDGFTKLYHASINSGNYTDIPTSNNLINLSSNPGFYCFAFSNIKIKDYTGTAGTMYIYSTFNTYSTNNPLGGLTMGYLGSLGDSIGFYSDCFYGYNGMTINFKRANTKTVIFTGNDLQFDYDVYFSSTISNNSQCESDLSNCQSDLAIATGNLSTCQSDYNSCDSDLYSCQTDYSSCSSSLGVCTNSLSSCNTTLGDCMLGQVGTGINRSSLFINGIQHVGKPLININIPTEISWDYESTGSVFELDVEGYNVDTDYIEGIISVNSYHPTSEDFTSVFVNGLTLIMPYIVILLFIIFIWKLIKRIFK